MPRPALRHVRALATAGVIATLFLAACGGKTSSSPSVLPTAVPNVPSTTPSPSATVVHAFTDQNWGQVLSDPATYKGATVSLSGTVFNVEQDSARTGIQIWTDPLRGEGNTVVIFPKQGFPDVHKDDQIEVQGTLVGEFDGKNDSGTALKLPKVQATSVKVIKSASPASASPSSTVKASQVAASSPAAAASAKPLASGSPSATSTFRVQGSEPTGLAVRAGPGITHRKMGVVHDGGLLDVIGPAAPGWDHVRGDGFEGYVSITYLAGPIGTSDQPLAKLTK